ncbi:hypothetical protein [Streptomyces glomeratus]|uniref:Uncharacterized protein n=1 Tax=Streptomyces glomeratus TaxID=284452 RepID=A0ABP6L3B3_9ACTN|nr:hypothetical protein [Streptomyces glomeratus]MCF1512024.1 hypothetical protein [Streptomyces glomeratus]
MAPHPDVAAPTEAWRGFAGQRWRESVDVRDFIQADYTPYEGGPEFLAGTVRRLDGRRAVSRMAGCGR